MEQNKNKAVVKYQRFKYSHEELDEALNCIRQKTMSLNEAHKQFNIPKGTLHNKIKNKVPLVCRMGPSTYLTKEEEDKLEAWIISKAKLGFPLHPEDVKDSVQKVFKACKRSNPFTDDRPGVKWFKLFLKRHTNICKKNTEVISKARAAVTEKSIRFWFKDVEEYLKEENCQDILTDGRRILNCDETGVQTCPKSGKLLGPKKMPNFYEVAGGSEKESITVLCTFSASGETLPPMVIYPYKRLPAHIVNSLPDNWAAGRSDSGWMVSSTFYEYVANVVHPWLVSNTVQFPVILFLDGHKSHLSLELSEFCSQNQIHLYCLPANATHIIQPCDVSIFKPLKTYWRKVCRLHKNSTDTPITKTNFGTLFQKAFEMITIETIKNGFKSCGIFPFNADTIDYSKCMSKRQEDIALQDKPRDEPTFVPTVEDYKTTKNVIKYILDNEDLLDQMKASNEVLISRVWQKCEKEISKIPKSTNNSSHRPNGSTNTSFSLSGDLDIENMAMEIDGIIYDSAFGNLNLLNEYDTNPTDDSNELVNLNFIEEQMEKTATPSYNDKNTDTEMSYVENDLIKEIESMNTEVEQISETTEEDVRSECLQKMLEPENEMEGKTNTKTVAIIRKLHSGDTLTEDNLIGKTEKQEKMGTDITVLVEIHTNNMEVEKKTSETEKTTVEAKNTQAETKTAEVKTKNTEVETKKTEDEKNNTEVETKNTEVHTVNTEEEIEAAEVETKGSEVETENTELEINNIEVEPNNNEESANNLWDKHLSWPKNDIKAKNKKYQREKAPYAITSKQWKAFYTKKLNEKLEKERLLKEKREARQKKKTETVTNAPKRKIAELKQKKGVQEKKRKREGEKKTDLDAIITESTETNLADNSESSNLYEIGDHVIVEYEKDYFPGLIKTMSNSEFEVSVMCLSGPHYWKWPLQPDIIWYKRELVKEKIETPILMNSRMVYTVPEMDKYNKRGILLQ